MLKIDKDQLLETMINEARAAIDGVVRKALNQPSAQAWHDDNVASFEK